jgi:3' exoribonuclease, RNase T-like
MNYYIDTEFIEGFHGVRSSYHLWKKPKAIHTIDLISIGIVSEDGREYYAVSKEFDLKLAWNKYDLLNPLEMGDEPEKLYWLRENVLRPLHKELAYKISGDMKNSDYFYNLSTFSYKSLKRLISIYGKSNTEIATEIQCFTAGIKNPFYSMEPIADVLNYCRGINAKGDINFYGYYADYDWVLFCSLFGRMMDLPTGYPMYCRDLKQIFDELGLDKTWKDTNVPEGNEHDALDDAHWNKRLYGKLIEVRKSVMWKEAVRFLK